MNKTRREAELSAVFAAGAFLFLSGFFCLTGVSPAKAAMADHLVINEIHIDGVVGAGGAEDDWVEIYNPTQLDVDLTGWSLQKHSKLASSTITKIALSGTIKAGGYYLAVRNTATSSLLALADLTSSGVALSGDNTVYLVNDNIKIENKNDENIVDFAGFGLAEVFEGSAAAPNPAEAKSIVRTPLGHDTDDNFADFVQCDSPTPQNTKYGSGTGDSGGTQKDLSGNVGLTVRMSEEPVFSIKTNGADISFSANGDAVAKVLYGLDASYGSASAELPISANVDAVISLNDLSCGTEYHYSVSVVSSSGEDSDQSADAFFTTLPCGIGLDGLNMTKTVAKAKNSYNEGWAWEFDITVWDAEEVNLKMQFDAWSGAGDISSAGNIRYSVDNTNWVEITADNQYPVEAINIGALDLNTDADGRQIKIYAQMKVPSGTLIGTYESGYAISIEK
jgi:hypothetical protein